MFALHHCKYEITCLFIDILRKRCKTVLCSCYSIFILHDRNNYNFLSIFSIVFVASEVLNGLGTVHIEDHCGLHTVAARGLNEEVLIPTLPCVCKM